jgi:hypothetical protein
MPASASELKIAWFPQAGPQTLLLKCHYDEIFYGGARGGGKTSGALGHWLQHQAQWGKHARGILFRRTYDELEEVFEQSNQLFPLIGAVYNVGKRTWMFRNGARLKFRFMERDIHAQKYQGHQYTWMCFEEITNWPSPDPIDKLRACLRSSKGVRCQWIATGNPGGVGHNWVKARFIDPMPPFMPFRDPITQVVRVFIPAKLQDNKILMQSDPGYVNRLKGTGPEWLVKAWLDGNWDIVAGGMFDDLWKRDLHILEPFKIPSGWIIDRAFDWGSSAPFSLGWWAESNGESLPDGRTFYRGTKIRIAEWYGWNGKPNKGLNLVDTEIARKALEMEAAMTKAHGYRFHEGPADPSIFTVTNGVSIASGMGRAGLVFQPAPTGAGSRKSGWELMRRMMKAAGKAPMEEPGLFVFSSCRQFIRTVPMLPRDLKNLDDVDTDSEDHIGDETRYELSFKRRSVKSQDLVGV